MCIRDRDWGDGYGVIFNIYRLDGAKAVRVVDGWSRSRWYPVSYTHLAIDAGDNLESAADCSVGRIAQRFRPQMCIRDRSHCEVQR